MPTYFGDEREPRTFRLQSDTLIVDVCTLGASLSRILAPDRQGKLDLVILGSPDWQTHLASSAYFGDIVGPYANRIAGAHFTIGDHDYQMDPNDRGNLLHGGPAGLHRWNWTVEESWDSGLALTVQWEDPAKQYPGPVKVSVVYAVRESTVALRITAYSPVAVPLNIVSHPYFNLAGARPGTNILHHVLQLNASHYLPIDETGIPTLGPMTVVGTPFDLLHPTRLRDVLFADHPQVVGSQGFDHAFATAEMRFGTLGWLSDPGSGRTLTITSDQPAIQVFTCGGFNGTEIAHEGPVGAYAAIALETEGFPDAPNRPDFPSTLVLPGMEFRSTTHWTFGTA